MSRHQVHDCFVHVEQYMSLSSVVEVLSMHRPQKLVHELGGKQAAALLHTELLTFHVCPKFHDELLIVPLQTSIM